MTNLNPSHAYPSYWVYLLLFFTFPFYLQAQANLNMELLSNWDGTSDEYNDIWGYVDDAGREYAIIGSYRQTHFIDITDPDNPSEVASILGNTSSSWRDFKTYCTYAYGVSEGNGSLQIFDLSNLPNQVTKVYDSTQFFTNCHNIFIDEQHGRLYAVGTNRANIVLLDLSVNPASPTFLKNINVQGGYIHDMYVRNHIGYCSHEGRGLYVYDFTNTNNVLLKGTLTSYTNKGYNHSSWLSQDGKTLTMADENHGLAVKVVDVSDLTDIEVVSTFKSTLETSTNSIAHNPFIVGDQYVAVSYYHDGVQVYDISNPSNPIKVAYYDTHASNTNYNGYTGSWGVYPYLPSGRVIASDIHNGLFVLQLDLACAFNHRIDGSLLEGNFYAAQNIVASATISTASPITFSAGRQINLEVGFESFLGGDFTAEIRGCQGVSSSVSTLTMPSETNSYGTNFLEVTSEPFKENIEIAVFPNPTYNGLSIKVQSPDFLPCQLHVLSADGSLLQQVKLSKEAASYQQDFTQFGEGIYILQFHTPQQLISEKVIVLKQ